MNEAFSNFQELENLPSRVLERGIEVRWSSLYNMLKSFVDNKKAIEKLTDEESTKPPSQRKKLPEFDRQQWRKMEKVKESLEVFCKATNYLQSRDASISIVIPLSESLKLHVQQNIDNDIGDEALNKSLLKHLKLRFDCLKDEKKYIISTMLNPNFKMICLDEDLKALYCKWISDELVMFFYIFFYL